MVVSLMYVRQMGVVGGEKQPGQKHDSVRSAGLRRDFGAHAASNGGRRGGGGGEGGGTRARELKAGRVKSAGRRDDGDGRGDRKRQRWR